MNAQPMTFLALLCGVMLLSAPLRAETPIREAEVGGAKILTDAKGMTLYTFDMDKDGASACYDQCAVNWPPLLAEAGAVADDDFGLTKRTDGTMQWTYYGMPLYLWVKDTAPGQTTGDGVKGVWHTAVAKE